MTRPSVSFLTLVGVGEWGGGGPPPNNRQNTAVGVSGLDSSYGNPPTGWYGMTVEEAGVARAVDNDEASFCITHATQQSGEMIWWAKSN